MKLEARREMELGHVCCLVAQEEYQVDRIRARRIDLLEVSQFVWLNTILGGTFEDGLETWRVLKLLVGRGILSRLQGGNRMVCP